MSAVPSRDLPQTRPITIAWSSGTPTAPGSAQIRSSHHMLSAGIQTDPPTAVYPVGATLNGSWIGSGDDTSYHFEWGPTASHGNSTPTTDAGATTGSTPVHFDLSGLTPEHTYHYRIVASNGIGTSVGEDRSFTTPPAVSDLSTDPVSELAPTGATLNGSWTGVGLDTHYRFEWGVDDGYGNTTPDTDAGTTTGHTPGQAQLNGLDPITTYHYRIDATDIYGTTVGPDQTFTTPPNHPLVTQWSSDVHSDSAALHATINPGGADTTYYFEYGTSTSYGTTTPIPDGDVGSSITDQAVSAQLTGLSTGTTYHYHVVAQNSADTTAGPDFTFRTFDYVPTLTDPCPNAHARQQTGAALLPDCRGYELVSAPSTGGYDVESDLVPGQNPFGGYPRTGQPKVLYAVHEGGIPGTGNPTNFGPDPYVATRTDNGWSTTYVGIPANGTQSSETFASTLLEADPVLDTFAFGGPNICSPCFGDGSTAIPLHLSGGSLVQGMVGSTPQPSATPDGLIRQHFSADGTHFVFGSSSQFEADGNSGGDVSVYDRNLRTGTTHVVSKVPAGGNLACLQGAGSCHSPGDGHGIAELGISADGSRILVGQLVSTDADGNERFRLYMNVGDADHTIDVTPGADAGVLYDGMTADGTKVFFTATGQLTADDHDTSADIYRADVSASDASLSRVSTGQGGVGDTDVCDPEGGWNSVSGGSNCDAVAIAGGGGVASGDGTVYLLSPSFCPARALGPRTSQTSTLRGQDRARTSSPRWRRATRRSTTPSPRPQPAARAISRQRRAATSQPLFPTWLSSTTTTTVTPRSTATARTATRSTAHHATRPVLGRRVTRAWLLTGSALATTGGCSSHPPMPSPLATSTTAETRTSGRTARWA